ncbi:MAG TPA: lipopolysaccharide assembly protein LapA domain-containing protein [Capillimicrobium sp.]
MSTDHEPSAPAKRDRRETTRQVAALLVGALIVVFAVLNLDDVEVNWVIATATTPLIVVIAASFVLGILAGLLIARGRARARRR